MAHAFSPNTQEVEAGGSEFDASLVYTLTSRATRATQTNTVLEKPNQSKTKTTPATAGLQWRVSRHSASMHSNSFRSKINSRKKISSRASKRAHRVKVLAAKPDSSKLASDTPLPPVNKNVTIKKKNPYALMSTAPAVQALGSEFKSPNPGMFVCDPRAEGEMSAQLQTSQNPRSASRGVKGANKTLISNQSLWVHCLPHTMLMCACAQYTHPTPFSRPVSLPPGRLSRRSTGQRSAPAKVSLKLACTRLYLKAKQTTGLV